MATIVNNPGTSDSSGANGMLMGIVILLAIIALFWFLGMPYLRGNGMAGEQSPSTVVENNVEAPESAQQAPAGDTNINIPVPDQVDVNVQNGQDGQ